MFEDVALNYYHDNDGDKLVLTNQDTKEEFNEECDKLQSSVKNPYEDIYIWFKKQYLETTGVYHCLCGIQNVMKEQLNTESKKKSDEKELEALNAGKKTLKSVFKSKSKKEDSIQKLQTSIEVSEKEIADYKELIKFIVVFNGSTTVPNFKSGKIKLYTRALLQFSV